MIRILHIPNYYPPHIGGIEDVCYNIVRIVKQKSDIEQQVICFNDKNETVNDIIEGVAVTRVAIKGVIASQPISTCYRRELKRIIKQFKPTHVHFHAPNPFVSFVLLQLLPSKTKLIAHWHSDIVAQKLMYLIVKPLENRLLKRANIILATSPTYITESKPLLKWRHKVEVLQNIIDPAKFIVDEKREQQIAAIKSQYKNLPIILFVGRHVPYKGINHLIEAAKLIKTPCEIVVGGKGALSDELKNMAKCLNNITFVGRIDNDELVAYFHAADIFAFPSITKNEAFGVVLAEAMYCNTVPITFTIKGSGVNWVNLNNETGIEVENSNAVALAEGIEKLLVDTDLRSKYAKNAKERVEAYMIAPIIEEKLNLLYR